MYEAIVVFLAVMGVSFVFAALFTSMDSAGIAALFLIFGIEAVMVLLLRSLYLTHYISKD